MPAIQPKISYPVPSNKNGRAFPSAEDLLSALGGESTGQYLVGSQGMWHGGIHITDATTPWCALSTDSEAEKAYRREPYKGEQFIRCMADGEIVAFRVCQDYESAAIPWQGKRLHLSTSFVLVKHYIQPGDTDASGLTFYTLYMQIAPFAAYATQGSERARTTKGLQRYYASADDAQAGTVAGSLTADTPVILSDNMITRTRDSRQFTEVTLAVETKNSAGVTLTSGTTVWTVSDQGFLKPPASSVPPPSWWSACAPAYGSPSTGSVRCTARTNWAYYLSRDDVLQWKKKGDLTAGFPLTYAPGNAAQQVICPGKQPSDASRTFSLVTLGRDVGHLKKGDRVWVVSDGDSLTPVTAAATSGTPPVFGDVVVPATPVAISAGDSIGHMGFYQLPDDNGKRSRYQVHIECLSMDAKLPTFLTNPEHVGEEASAFVKYPEGAALFNKNAAGEMVDSTRKTRTQGILTRSKVPVEDKNGQPAYYQIYREMGWLAASSVQTVSRYALGALGFVTVDKAPESFDLIDGIKQPNNVVKGILEQMYKGAQDETRSSHMLNEYNYKRLLDLIDSNHDGYYSEEEYLQAIHNVSYRDHLYRIIAKHGSEWYYGKDDPLFKTYLDTLKDEALVWKAYTEEFIDKMGWMKKVAGMGPEPWHMHPVTFLDAITQRGGLISLAMLRKIWVDNRYASDDTLQQVANELNANLDLCHLNSEFRLYHFMAQVRQEVGANFSISENLNYAPSALPVFFSYYRRNTAEQELDGRTSSHPANQENIANKAYGGRNGNNMPGDGWRYRGRGMKQLTGRVNYKKFTEYHASKWGGDIDFVNKPELLVDDIKYAVRSALAFWDDNEIYIQADKGYSLDVSLAVTNIVNSGLSLDEKKLRYGNLEDFLSRKIFQGIY